MKELKYIQQNLKVPKGNYNSFGKYKYRSCEDILEAVKPLLKETDSILKLSDDLVNIGERYYVKATATIIAPDGSSETTTAHAREDESKKGMDGSQITGTASSYARKYALNGLFAIDDTKDADTDEFKFAQQKAEKQETHTEALTTAKDDPHKKISKAHVKKISEQAELEGVPIDKICELFGIDKIENLTVTQESSLLGSWTKLIEKARSDIEKGIC